MTDQPVSRSLSASDRRLQIERLRLQAAYERLIWRQHACNLVHGLQPQQLVAQVSEHLHDAGLGFFSRGLRIWQRYPLLGGLLVSVLGRGGRRSKVLGALLGAGLFWLRRRHKPN